MVSRLVQNMIPSATVEMSSKVKRLKAEGIDVIDFSLGEPDFNTPDNIVCAAKKAMDTGCTKYTEVAGILPLRQAICAKLLKDNHVAYQPGEIVVSTGAKQAINNVMQVVCNPGDEVILPTPCWVSYIEIIKLAGAVPVLVPTCEKDDFQLDVSLVAKSVTNKTRAVILTSPNNPTGAVYAKKAMEDLAELVVKQDIYVLSDEIYEKLIYGENEHMCFASLSPEVRDRTAVINGFSKTYAMTGWRIGYSATSEEIAKGIASLQGHTTFSANTISQYASIEALNSTEDSINSMCREFGERRRCLLERLRGLPGITCPDAQGAFYLMPNVSSYYDKTYDGKKIGDSAGFCAFILDKANVALVPGSAFEAPDHIRISYSNSLEKIQKGMGNIENALKLLS